MTGNLYYNMHVEVLFKTVWPFCVTIGLKFVKLSPLGINGVKPGVIADVFGFSKTINNTVLIRKRD